MKLTGWIAWWSRVAKQVGDRDPHYKYPQVKPCRDPEKPGYIIKLTGWSAWWDRVSRQESRVGKMSKVVSLEAKRKKTEIEKRIFVEKYFSGGSERNKFNLKG